MIVGNIAPQDMERIYKEARLPEPFVYVYREGGIGLIAGLVVGYFEEKVVFGPTCVFQHVIVTKHARDREKAKIELSTFALRAAFARPCRTVITCIESKHPLYAMLREWTTKTLGGEWYADDADSSWFFIRKEHFNG